MPSMSPRTQQMQMGAGAGIDQATQLFESGFSEMAYNVLGSKLPDVLPDVVTFKVLDADVDSGTAVGAFVLMRGGMPLYVPVVMSSNAMKPIELCYHKGLNIFLPLSKQWLEEIERTALGTMGKGIKTPETLYSDVDIRNIVVPPITGRFSYAAWEPVVLADVARVLAPAFLEKDAEERPLALLGFLHRAPEAVKAAFLRVLEKAPRLLKEAASVYGIQPLSEALRPRREKAAAKQLHGGGLWIADKDTTPIEFQRIFGDQAAEAYAGVRLRGYAAKDERMNRNIAVQEQPYARWVEPNQPGVYLLTDRMSKDRAAFVMPNPIDVMALGTRYGRRPAVPGHNPVIDNSYKDPESYGPANRVYPQGRPNESNYATQRHVPRYLAVFANGDYVQPQKLVGRDSVADGLDGGTLHERMFKSLAGAPKVGKGFFFRSRGTTFQATVPLEIRSMMTDSEGIRRITVSRAGESWTEKQVITDPRHPYDAIWMPKGANVVYLPPDFVWIPLGKKLPDGDVFTSALDLQSCASSALASVGARKVAIKNAGARQFSIDGGTGQGKIATLKALAHGFALPVDVAEALVEKAAAERSVRFWAVSHVKLAQAQALLDKEGADDGGDKKKDPKPKKKDPSGGGKPPDPGADGDLMADPEAQAQMAAAMAPPEPPPPTPTDLAAMEMQQHIDAEMQKLHEQKAMLAMLTQRANEIASGAPPLPTVQSQAMGAPPPSINMATGAPVPTPDVPPGPSLGGAAAMAAGAPPQDPSGMMAGAPPQDPSGMMAGAPPQDPSGMMAGAPPPPMAMMGQDGLDATAIERQINPQFLQQAAQLHSGDVFDAAAISSLAQSPMVKEIVGQYLPNLEKALDNLARVLLTLWMQEAELKKQVGEAAFADLEDSLRNTFRGMGDLVLKLSQGAHALPDPGAHADA